MGFYKRIFDNPEPGATDSQIVTISEIHQLLEARISAVLGPLGFEVRGPLTWIRNVDVPIRQMFELKQWKGGVLAPSWGLSLDFVPHVSGSSVKWHRTPKSALLDFRVDARRRESDMSYIRGPSKLVSDAPGALEAAFPQAREWWTSVPSVTELPHAYERLKQYYSHGGLGFYNFVQHPIAYAFALAKVGRANEANDEIERYSNLRRPPAVEARIRELLSLATES